MKLNEAANFSTLRQNQMGTAAVTLCKLETVNWHSKIQNCLLSPFNIFLGSAHDKIHCTMYHSL